MAVGVVARQVIDIPEVSALTTEYRMHKRHCACGTVTSVVAPPEATGPVVYEPHLWVVAVYPLVFRHVPVERTAMLQATRPAAPDLVRRKFTGPAADVH